MTWFLLPRSPVQRHPRKLTLTGLIVLLLINLGLSTAVFWGVEAEKAIQRVKGIRS